MIVFLTNQSADIIFASYICTVSFPCRVLFIESHFHARGKKKLQRGHSPSEKMLFGFLISNPRGGGWRKHNMKMLYGNRCSRQGGVTHSLFNQNMSGKLVLQTFIISSVTHYSLGLIPKHSVLVSRQLFLTRKKLSYVLQQLSDVRSWCFVG